MLKDHLKMKLDLPKHVLLVTLLCSNFVFSYANADTVSRLYASGTGYTNSGYVNMASNSGLWFDMKNHWPAAAVAQTAYAANWNNISVVGSGSGSCGGPQSYIKNEQCESMYSMTVTGGTLSANKVFSMLFLSNEALGGGELLDNEGWTGISVSNGSDTILTINGDAAASAMGALIKSRTLTYNTTCKWFNIGGVPKQQCGWLNQMMVN